MYSKWGSNCNLLIAHHLPRSHHNDIIRYCSWPMCRTVNYGTQKWPNNRKKLEFLPPKCQKCIDWNAVFKTWLALPVGNEDPHQPLLARFVGDETSLIPYESGQPEKSWNQDLKQEISSFNRMRFFFGNSHLVVSSFHQRMCYVYIQIVNMVNRNHEFWG